MHFRDRRALQTALLPRWYPQSRRTRDPRQQPRPDRRRSRRRMRSRDRAAGHITQFYEECLNEVLHGNHPKSLAFADRRFRAAFENGLLTSAGRHRRERETLGRFSTRADGSFRTPNATGSEPRLSEAGGSVVNPAKKGGKRRKPRGSLSAWSR